MTQWILVLLIHCWSVTDYVTDMQAVYQKQVDCEKQRDVLNEYYKTKDYLCINSHTPRT